MRDILSVGTIIAFEDAPLRKWLKIAGVGGPTVDEIMAFFDCDRDTALEFQTPWAAKVHNINWGCAFLDVGDYIRKLDNTGRVEIVNSDGGNRRGQIVSYTIGGDRQDRDRVWYPMADYISVVVLKG